MDDNEVALVLPEPGALALLEHIESGDLVVRHVGRIPVIVTSSLLDWVDGNSSSNPSTLVTPLRVSAKHRAEADRLMKRSTGKNPQSNKEK